jgi:Protein of unknown function (DUF3383)
MSTVPPLPLSDIVDITVTISPTAASPNPFNQGLFIGPSTVIPSYGANSRLLQFTSTSAMLEAGFTNNDPEYIAAQIYFSQTPTASFIWIGRQDLTAIGTFVIDVAGTGWAVGDEFSIGGAGTNGIGKVTAETGGVPSAISLVQQGTGYVVATGLSTTALGSSTGAGLTVSVTALGESLLQAAQACRAASTVWYGLAVNNPADADNLALAEWADPLWQTTRYYLWSNDVAIPNGVADNLALQLQTLELRVLGIYSTTQGGLFPNNVFAAAGLMGVEMGLNTGLANSFFTTAHKQIAGIAPEPLTQTQFTNIKTAGFNVYCNFNPYQLVEPGFMSNGAPSYLWLFLAVLVAQMQNLEVGVLASNPAVQQTNAGQQLLLNAADTACTALATIGFIAGGLWEGIAFNIPGVSIATGQALPSGFSNQSQPYAFQSIADRDAGKAQPIYCFIITAGAVQSLLIGIYTQL